MSYNVTNSELDDLIHEAILGIGAIQGFLGDIGESFVASDPEYIVTKSDGSVVHVMGELYTTGAILNTTVVGGDLFPELTAGREPGSLKFGDPDRATVPNGGLKSLANRNLPDAESYVIGRTEDP